MLSKKKEVTTTQKTISDSIYMKYSKHDQWFLRAEIGMGVRKEIGKGTKFVLGVIKCLKLSYSLGEHSAHHWTKYLKWLSFTVCELYNNKAIFKINVKRKNTSGKLGGLNRA